VTALADAVACRRRQVDSNRISTIANGAFTGLTALTWLYGAWLWGLGYLWFSLLSACMDAGVFSSGRI
jgi:hypothetical protein